MFLRTAVLVCCFVRAFYFAEAANCPHTDTTLKKFSETFITYDENTKIVIDEGILLDIECLHVGTIDIIGSGSLVFNRDQSIEIKTKGIYVKDDASLIIGSEECRHTDDVKIILQGTRTADRSTLTGAGEKYIAVTNNGTLHIYGEDKLAWTKLTTTIQGEAYTGTPVYRHQDSADKSTRRWYDGLSLYVFDSALQKKSYYVHDLSKNTAAEEEAAVNVMIDALNGVAEGDLVAMSVHNSISHKEETDVTGLYETIEQLAGMDAGSLLLRNSDMYDAFSLIFVKGGAYNQDQTPSMGYQSPVRAIAALEYEGHRVIAETLISYKRAYMSHVDLRIMSLEDGYPEIQVFDDVTAWEAGDQILITSTDYVWYHAEVLTIHDIVGTNTIQLTRAPTYRHFGEIENGVDMRAEVALLSRNIKIEGEMSHDCPASNGNCDILPYDTYGGHIKIIASFTSVVIDGAELKHMGQRTDMGFYPIHFHMCLDVTGKTALVRRNSIHDTFSRAVTVHGTYGTSPSQPGVQVIENVAYLINGHAYFLEDGIERATILERNLVASVRTVPGDFVTDVKQVSGFWITTPQVVVIGNVAAGGPCFGFWYTFPDEPVGPSKGHVYQKNEARQSALWTCDNNVAHSNSDTGFFFDHVLLDNMGRSEGVLRYGALADPLDSKSATVKAQIVRLTSYKNRKLNAWIRGGEIEVIQMSSAESKRGLQLATGNLQVQTLKKSVFVGRSVLNGEPEDYPDALKPKYLPHYLGTVFYDGPVYFESTWYTNFYNDPNNEFVAGALGFNPTNKFSSSADNGARDLRFAFNDQTEGNRVFDGMANETAFEFGNFNGDENSVFRDEDGSVTNCPGDTGLTGPVSVVKPEKFVLTNKCEYRENWQMTVCDEKYGQVQFITRGVFSGSFSGFAVNSQARRVSYDDPTDTAYEDHDGEGGTVPEFAVVLGNQSFYYEHQYEKKFPKKVEIRGTGVERGYSFVIGTCLPAGTTREDLTLQIASQDGYKSDANVGAANSLRELADSTKMDKVFIDGRMLYVKVISSKTRDPTWDKFDRKMCAGSSCPALHITLNTEKSYTPCFTPTPAELSTDIYIDNLPRRSCQYPPSGQPESDWGAGDTMLAARDGNWGEWGSWAECCNAVGVVSTTTRKRVCDNPPKFGTGADCPGDAQETGPCGKDCPVDGVLADWGSWSDCMCDGRAAGSSGVKVLRRECTGTANGGKYCSGYLEYFGSCDGNCDEN